MRYQALSVRPTGCCEIPKISVSKASISVVAGLIDLV
jgi:hypothetical protein